MTFIAFAYQGEAYNLGDCGDYEIATEIADDALGIDNWQFIMSTDEIKYILKTAEGV